MIKKIIGMMLIFSPFGLGFIMAVINGRGMEFLITLVISGFIILLVIGGIYLIVD